MKKYGWLCIALLLQSFSLLAQELPYALQKAQQPIRIISGTFPAYQITESLVDVSGNTYITGYFRGQADFEPGAADSILISQLPNVYDAFLAKYDDAGNLLYAKMISGGADKRANTIALTSGGKVLIAGYFFGTANFDPGASDFSLVSNGGSDGYFCRYDATTGTFETAASLGGLGNDGTMKMMLDGANLAYLYGYFAQTMDFDFTAGVSELTAINAQDRFIAKYDASLVLQWVQGLPNLNVTSLALDASGFYAGGNFSVGADMDPGAGDLYTVPIGSSDIWLSKFDLNGNLLWNNVIGGVDFENVFDLTLDASSNVYLSGNFNQATDFDPSPVVNNVISNGVGDAYVAKYDVNGFFQWVRTFGGSRNENAPSLTMLQNNILGVTINFQSASIDADPQGGTRLLINSGPDTFGDAALVLLTDAGSLIDAYRYGVSAVSETAGLINSNGLDKFAIVGNFTNPLDFDPSSAVVSIPNVSGFQQGYLASYSLLASLPVAQPTALTLTNQTGSSIDVSFTGSGADGYVVVRRANQAPISIPRDGTSLTTGEYVTDAQVVYSGASTSFIDQNLSANTTYHYAAYAYNNVNGSVNYLITAPLLGSSTTTSISYSRATDSLALVALYNAANGPGWTNSTNWLTGYIHTWNGVTVNVNRVTRIALGSNLLSGTLPSSIGNLSALDTLELWGNQLTGAIPPELGSLTSLLYMDLSPNLFTGTIPSELGNLTSLTTLWLNNNKLTGGIPVELGSLTLLQHLYLQGNQLSDSIPAALGNLNALLTLDLSSNKLSGTIPVELGNLSTLVTLNLTANQLSGTIPVELAGLTALQILQLDQNQLSGVIPAELGGMSALRTLKLNSNALTGTIPPELGSLTSLQLIDLGGNTLTGSVPSALCSISSLQTLGLARNQLSGVFPSEVTSAISLVNLWIDNNQFTGTFPSINSTTNPLIDGVTLNNNQFDGLPDLSTLNGILSYIDVSNNNFTFEDLESNAGIAGISYAPQNLIPGTGDQLLNRGDLLTLAYTIGGSSNLYQWKKNGVDISLATATSYSQANVTGVDGGVYTLEASNSLVPGLIIVPGPVKVTVVQNYYWIGNGGDWKDISHWSLTSGSIDPPPALPGKDDNVFFDANSFNLAGQVVFIEDDTTSYGVDFRTMDWRGVTNNPTFQILATVSDWIGNSCHGSIYLDDNMSVNFNKAEFYMSSDTNYEFDTRGHYLGQNCWLQFNAINPVTANILSDINHAWMYANKGTVNLNGHSFIGQVSDYPAIWLAGTSATPATFNVSNSIVDVGTITINPFNTLIDDNAEITLRTKLNASDQNFNYLKLGSVTLTPANSSNTYDTLEILAGATVNLPIGVVAIGNAFIANGTVDQPIRIASSTTAIQATVGKANGIVAVSYVELESIAATGGATFNALNSWDEGNNSGWNFIYDNPLSDTDIELLAAYQVQSQDSLSYSTLDDFELDATDNMLVVGSYQGTVDFDPTVGTVLLTATSSEEDFIAKYSSIGTLEWVHALPSVDPNNYAQYEAITSDAGTNVILGGALLGTYDLNPGAGVNTLSSNNPIVSDPIFVKYDNTGNFVWAKQLLNTSASYADIESLTTDDAGNILIAGSFSNGSLDMDPSGFTAPLTTSDSYGDVFVAKYSTNGDYLWAVQIGTNNVYDEDPSITTDSQNNIYISYEVSDTIDHHVIEKYSPAGALVWSIENDRARGTGLRDLTIDEPTNRIYAVGSYRGTPTFTGTSGSGTLPTTGLDIESGYVVAYDLNGAFVNVVGFQSSEESYPVSVNVLDDGNLLITGGYEGEIDMDPSAGTYKNFYPVASFLTKLTPAGDFIWGASIQGSYGFASSLNSQNELTGILFFENATVDVEPGPGVFNISTQSNNEDFAILRYDLQGGVLSADSLALEAFYYATGGPTWTNQSNWLNGDISTWFGVTVTNDRITAITLPNNNLSGTIPSDALILNDLISLDVSGNTLTAVPDFSTLEPGVSINISDNTLDFASLEYNMDVAGINYLNQKAITIAPDSVLIASGDDYTLNAIIGGTANSYQWNRNTVSINNSTADSVVVENISRQNMGSYSLSITNSLVPNLTLTTVPVNILATATLSGKLLLPTTAANAGIVRLLRVTSSNGYDTLKTQNVSATGDYIFNQVVLDDYQIVGFADTLQVGQERALPTYYPSTIYWEEADTLFVENSLSGLDITSLLKPTDPLTDDGVIFGFVQEDDGTGSRTEKTSRVKGSGVSARRAQDTGRGKVLGELVAYVFTDENGEFSLAGLPTGTYRINIQYPGYPMDETSFIDIQVGSTPLDELVNVEATVADGKITVRELVITSVEGGTYKVEAYPNPTNSAVTITFEEKAPQRFVKLLDAKGNSLFTQAAPQLSVNLDVRALQSGLYLIKVVDKGSEVKTIRISVTK